MSRVIFAGRHSVNKASSSSDEPCRQPLVDQKVEDAVYRYTVDVGGVRQSRKDVPGAHGGWVIPYRREHFETVRCRFETF